MSQVPSNEIPHTVASLDWRDITCQSAVGCTNQATHIVHLHAVDECNQPDLDPFGNVIDILCMVCIRDVEVEVLQRVHRLTGHPGMYCLTCGAPVGELRDIIREVAPL